MEKKFYINKSQGIFFWIEGYSGSGKSTIGKMIFNSMNHKFGKTILIHGNEIRKLLDLKGFEKKDRISNSHKSSELIKFLLDSKINVIYTTVCLNHTARDIYAKKSKNFFNILIQSNIKKIIKNKKKKKIYSLKNNIVGIHIKPEFPKKKVVVIQNNLYDDLRVISKKLLKKISNIKLVNK
jgi:cytidine diphosphoramidate kinase